MGNHQSELAEKAQGEDVEKVVEQETIKERIVPQQTAEEAKDTTVPAGLFVGGDTERVQGEEVEDGIEQQGRCPFLAPGQEAEEGSPFHAGMMMFGGSHGNKGHLDGRQSWTHNYATGSKYFGMFTDAGNEGVFELVQQAKNESWDWPKTLEALCELADSDSEKYGEATDTMVREIVYDAIGATGEFYI